METGLVLLSLVMPLMVGHTTISDELSRQEQAQAYIVEEQKRLEEEQRLQEEKEKLLNETMIEGFIAWLLEVERIRYRLGRFDEAEKKFDCVGNKPIKRYAQKEQQDLVDYAREVSNCNKDFILTIERESGFRWDAVGDGGTSYGLCQWHVPGQKDWRTKSNDPAIQNGYNMIDKCRWSWQKKEESGGVGNWLYGYRVRHTVEERFAFYK